MKRDENGYVQFEQIRPYDEQIKEMDIKQLLEEYDIGQVKLFLIKKEILERCKK